MCCTAWAIPHYSRPSRPAWRNQAMPVPCQLAFGGCRQGAQTSRRNLGSCSAVNLYHTWQAAATGKATGSTQTTPSRGMLNCLSVDMSDAVLGMLCCHKECSGVAATAGSGRLASCSCCRNPVSFVLAADGTLLTCWAWGTSHLEGVAHVDSPAYPETCLGCDMRDCCFCCFSPGSMHGS